MKITRYITTLSLIVALMATMMSCQKKATSTSTSGIATVVCDGSFQNFMAQEIDVFEYIYKDASIIPYYADEKAAVDSLLDLKTKAIVISRELSQKEIDYLKDKGQHVKQSKIAVDAIAIIVNPENTVNVLSKKEIAEILSGKFTKWNQIEPSKLGDISVVFDHEGSSTVQYMRDSLLNGGKFGDNVFAQKTPQGVFEAVASNKNAIGIIGVSWISSDLSKVDMSSEERYHALENNDTTNINFDEKIKVIKVRGNDQVTAYKPYQAYIMSGDYPLFRPVYMIIDATNGTITHGFYSFVTSFRGQKIIQGTGILPATVRPQMVEITTH